MSSVSSLPLVLWISFAFIVALIIMAIIRHLIVTHRLHLLSLDVIEHDPLTFEHLFPLACHSCKGRQHLRSYRYGSGDTVKMVSLCGDCTRRLERMIRTGYQAYLSTHPQEQPKDGYQDFSARTPRSSIYGSRRGAPLVGQRYQRAAMSPMRHTIRR